MIRDIMNKKLVIGCAALASPFVVGYVVILVHDPINVLKASAVIAGLLVWLSIVCGFSRL